MKIKTIVFSPSYIDLEPLATAPPLASGRLWLSTSNKICFSPNGTDVSEIPSDVVYGKSEFTLNPSASFSPTFQGMYSYAYDLAITSINSQYYHSSQNTWYNCVGNFPNITDGSNARLYNSGTSSSTVVFIYQQIKEVI